MLKWFDFALNPRLEGTEELYFRKTAKGFDFNTYFNYVPQEKLKKYTNASKVLIEDNSVFVECENVRQVNCAIIFCTYKREKYIKRNVGYLAERIKNQSDFSCKIIVVDNGKTLSKSDFDSETVLIGNKNDGGSGGFKRGMEEASKIGGFTHFILMDDDVEIDFVAVQKLLNFLRFLKPEYRDLAVAGSMLYLDKPTIQFEAGGYFGKDGKQKAFGHFLDLSKAESLVLNEQENDINYGGWWFMCMPFRCIEEGNFPQPFFLKYDDVEYALRCKLKIITLNGVGVWHRRFEDKYNSSSEYYNTRNYLHLCKIYCNDFDSEKWVREQISEKEKRWQYKMAEAIRLGYLDFLKGLSWLENIDAEENHRQISGLNYDFLNYDEIKKQYGVRPENNKFYSPVSKKEMLLALIRLSKKWVFVDCFHDDPRQYKWAEKAVHCDCVNNCGYVTCKNKEKKFQHGK